MNKEQKKKVLLIEDHPDIVSMYKVIFDTKIKADFLVATDMTSGMKMINEERPDLVLLDIIIPETEGKEFKPTSRHGFQLLQLVRKDESLKDIKVIVLTNLESTPDRERAESLGALDYVVKSHTLPNQVAEKVNKILAGK